MAALTANTEAAAGGGRVVEKGSTSQRCSAATAVGRNIKDKSLKPDDGGEINLWAYLIFGTLSNCPGKEVKNEDWLMAEVMNQHDTDRPDEKTFGHNASSTG